MWHETTMHLHALSMCSVSLKRVYKYPANALLRVFIESREFNNGEKNQVLNESNPPSEPVFLHGLDYKFQREDCIGDRVNEY